MFDPVAQRLAIRSVKLRGRGEARWLVCKAEGGRGGCVPLHPRFPVIRSLLDTIVVPAAIGFDARRVHAFHEHLLARKSVYKLAGLPLWTAAAHVELAMWDLLGRAAGLPAHALLSRLGPDGRPRGGADALPARQRLAVYITRFDRDASASAAVDAARAALAACGARAVKFKIGKRMHTDEAQDRRDLEMLAMARKTLGDEVTIYVDGNGSYTAEQAIAMGRRMAEHGVAWFEEPCPFEDYESTAAVAAALDIPVAGGEQDSSLLQFDRVFAALALGVVNIDVYYVGGLTRAWMVAHKAAAHGVTVAPHSPRIGDRALPAVQLAAVWPGVAKHLEHRGGPDVVDGHVAVPTKPGLGYRGGPRL